MDVPVHPRSTLPFYRSTPVLCLNRILVSAIFEGEVVWHCPLKSRNYGRVVGILVIHVLDLFVLTTSERQYMSPF